MQRIGRIFMAALFCVLCAGVYSIAEEITLTTYYPAPYGNYEELQATKFAVGSSATMPSGDGDMTASGTIQANTAFNINGTDGHTPLTTYTVITDVQINGAVLQKKSRNITVSGGIVTNVGSETAWTDVGTVNP